MFLFRALLLCGRFSKPHGIRTLGTENSAAVIFPVLMPCVLWPPGSAHLTASGRWNPVYLCSLLKTQRPGMDGAGACGRVDNSSQSAKMKVTSVSSGVKATFPKLPLTQGPCFLWSSC